MHNYLVVPAYGRNPMKEIRQIIKKWAIVQRFLQWRRKRRRWQFAYSYYQPQLNAIHLWLEQSREETNFTYHLQDLNRQQLAGLIATVTAQDISTILGYMAELDTNEALRQHIITQTEQSPDKARADLEARYGRRMGWYCLVRATRPKIVIETGVDRGLGACVLTSALMKNAGEDHPGYYYGTDIDPTAGYLFTKPYTEQGEILYGDSLTSLEALPETVDLFINDSDHSAEYEAKEYAMIQSKLSAEAIILGDNSHATDKLFQFAQETGRSYVFFAEKPKDHWYPGAGIGIAFPKRKRENA